MNRDALEKFLNLEIDVSTLSELLGGDLISLHYDNTIQISKSHVRHLLELYRDKKISRKTVFDWCIIMRYYDLYEYPDNEDDQEAIAVVIDEIDDLEDFEEDITPQHIEKWLNLLT